METTLRRAAVEMFASRGYAATGIRNIAQAAGLTSGTMYHYTSSKEMLLADIMVEGQQQLNREAADQLTGVVKPEDQLATLVAGLTMSHAVNPQSSRVIDSEVRSLEVGSEHRATVVELRDAYERFWLSALAAGAGEGVFDIEDLHMARLGLLNMCTGLNYWYRTTGELDSSQMANYFVDLALGTVRAKRDGKALRSRDVPALSPDSVRRFPFEPHP